MGDLLVVFAVSEESLASEPIHVFGEGRGVRELTAEERALPVDELLRLHPDASVCLPVPLEGIWQPPPEPMMLWGRRRTAQDVREHSAAMARSLEAFLNQRLGGLCRMVRTGWWVLGRVAVKVTEMEPVPDE
ncbi:MAG: hypothetical protein ACODAG_09600 [Myxococcota bacterium]